MALEQIKTDPNRGIGTKRELRAWLQSMKRMTYTKYSSLPTDVKQDLMEEYKKKLQTSRSTVVVEAPKVK